MYRQPPQKYPFGTTSAVYFTHQPQQREQLYKSREASEQKQQKAVQQHPISQIVYSGSMRFTPTVRKMSKEMNVTLDNYKQESPNLQKQRQQLESEWNKILDKSKSLQDNLMLLKNCISSNLNKKHENRSSKESTQSGQSQIKLQKVNSTCKLKSPFKIKRPQLQHKKQESIFSKIESKLNLKIGDFLGRGKFSEVHLAIDQGTGLIFALKMIKKSIVKECQMEEQLGREILFQSKLRHPNIVRMYGQSYDENYVYMMLEYCNGGEMFQHQYKQPNKRFNESIASNYINQILNAIDYMHKQGYMHRDMKTENILLSMNEIKICDLGCVREIPEFDERRTTFCGTVDYIAPEVIGDQGYDEKCDVWQIAILAYELVNGNTPFAEMSRDDEAIMENILQNKIELPREFSQNLKDFVLQGLHKQPELRISLEKMLIHPWIIKNSKTIEQCFWIQ